MIAALFWAVTTVYPTIAEEFDSGKKLVWTTNDPAAVERIGRDQRLIGNSASASVVDLNHANTFRTVGFVLEPRSVKTLAASPCDFLVKPNTKSDGKYLDWDRLLIETSRAPARSALDWNEVLIEARHPTDGIRATRIFVRVDSLMNPVCGAELDRAVEQVRRRTGWPVTYLGPSLGYFTVAVSRQPSPTIDAPDKLQIYASRTQFEKLTADARAAGTRLDGVSPSTNLLRVHTTAGYFDGDDFVAEWRSDFDGEVNISQRFPRACQRLLKGDVP